MWLIQLEPLNVETLLKPCRVGLVKAIFIFLNFILFKITLESNEAGASYKPTNTSQWQPYEDVMREIANSEVLFYQWML